MPPGRPPISTTTRLYGHFTGRVSDLYFAYSEH
jgi:hypothetical protein